MDGSDWFNAQISNDMLGTHPKGGHSASIVKTESIFEPAVSTYGKEVDIQPEG